MKIKFQHMFVLCLAIVTLRSCCCGKVKKFQSNGRISGVTENQTVHSLLECAVLIENSLDSVSFNFYQEEGICELSDSLPGHLTVVEGWNVYTKIVDGAWASWMTWGSCSGSCGGTRARTRSCTNPSPTYEGAECPGQSTENELCYELSCFHESGYYNGTDEVTWETAKSECEAMNTSLVVLESQAEIDFLQTMLTGFKHWIGLTCSSLANCTFIDGRSLENRFKAWAPGEPNYMGRSCVWIGWYGKKWDDTNCHSRKKYICEV